ncbi:DUF5719 family protein [Nocardioides rubriscoriae]|uniref:DUF5719 family protein n=1 Tax=Nocardioides rubriscoriae TaxID=642762 RepID=UPI0011DFE03B|nr:DUF5719 family protein [Nocardioides rubriscoriae]
MSSSRTARVKRARLDVTTVAAVVIPLLALLAALLVDTGTTRAREGAPPEETPLTRASVVCPAGGSDVLVTSTSGVSGQVDVRAGGSDPEAVDVAPGATTTVPVDQRAVVVTGEGALAPGLVAGRFSAPLASFDCRPPVFDQWFTGVGAGAKHRSILQLVNPDEGRAVVDVTVLGADGVVDAPQLLGVTVEGGASRSLPLAEILPRRDELALHVTVVRGRIAASVRDTVRGLGGGRTGDDGLASQAAPATSNLVLGIPSGSGPRTLVLANPTTSQGRATVSLVTRDAVFEPRGLDAVDLPPQSVVVVPVAEVLRAAGTGDGQAVGLQVDSTVATTASLSMFVKGDLATAVPVAPLAGAGTAVLPDGGKGLLLGDADAPGVVTVVARKADGTVLQDKRVEVAPGRADTVALPDGTRLVTVTPARTSVAAVVLVVSDGGATVVRLRAPVTTGLVPDVRVGPP